jgi:hypothetical protein
VLLRGCALLKTFDEITGYVYRAETFCPKCLKRHLYHRGEIDKTMKSQDVEDMLGLLAAERKVNRFNEWSYDSDAFPKVIFASDAELMPDFCSMCEKFV